jgi:hypothetical protein
MVALYLRTDPIMSVMRTARLHQHQAFIRRLHLWPACVQPFCICMVRTRNCAAPCSIPELREGKGLHGRHAGSTVGFVWRAFSYLTGHRGTNA